MGEDKQQVSATETPKKKMTVLKKILFVFECIIIVLCVAMAVLVLVNPDSVDENGNAKAQMLTIQTDSMEPTIPVHALLFTKAPGDGIIDLNTVVTFVITKDDQRILDTHRLVGYVYRNTNTNDGEMRKEYWSINGVHDEASFYAKYPKADGWEIIQYVTRGDKYTSLYGDFNDYSVDNSNGAEKEGWDDSAISLTGIVAVSDGKYIAGVGGFIDYIKTPIGVFVVIMIPLILLLVYQIVSLVRIIVKTNVAKVKEQVTMTEEEIKKKAIEEYLKAQGIATPTDTVEQADAEVQNIASEKTNLEETSKELPQEEQPKND